MKVVRFIDLFAGTGGIRLAFEQALAQYSVNPLCVKSVEIDEKASSTYNLNFNESPLGDVRQVVDIEPFDVLLAGFPCQAFSYAGKQKGFGDTRGTLFFEVERLLQKYHPKLCFLENVRGLTTHDDGKTFQTILSRLHALGYQVEYRLINASTLGVPQNRTRIYLFCTLEGNPSLTIESNLGAADSHAYKTLSPTLFGQSCKQLLVNDVLEENPSTKYDCSKSFRSKLEKITRGDLTKLHGVRLIDTRHGNSIHSWDIGKKGECSREEIEFMNLLVSNRRKHDFGTLQDGKALTIEQIATFYKKKDLQSVVSSLLAKGYIQKDVSEKINLVCGNMSFEVFKFLDPNSVSITLTSSDANRLGVYHNGRVRRLTPRECARLQGYPDTYILNPSDASAYKQLGNAVCVPVIRDLFIDLFKNTHGLLDKIQTFTNQVESPSRIELPSVTEYEPIRIPKTAAVQLTLFESQSLFVINKSPITLLGTYRKTCRDWITQNNLYNYPVTDDDIDAHNEFRAVSRLVLMRQKDEPLYFAIHGYSFVSKTDLSELGYKTSKNHPARMKYILYKLEKLCEPIPIFKNDDMYIIGNIKGRKSSS